MVTKNAKLRRSYLISQKGFDENSYVSILNYLLLYLILILAVHNPSDHPMFQPYFYIPVIIILFFRFLLIWDQKESKFNIGLSKALILLCGLIFPAAYFSELSSEIPNNNLLIVLPIWLIGVSSAAALGLYKRFKILYIYLAEMLLIPMIFLLFSPNEPNRLIFSIALVLMFIYLVFYSRKNYLIYSQLETEKLNNEIINAELLLSKKEIENANKDLNKALQSAHDATRAKSEFLANMSHEIRTPMNGIIGVVELLQDQEVNLDKLNMLKIIDESSSSLLNLINDILDFSKIEAGKFIINSEDFNLHKLLESIIDRFAIKTFDKGVELMLYVEKDVPEFLIGDEHRLSQILVNLLSNAVKFTEQGQVFLHVSMVKSTDNQHQILFSIEDTGIGISTEKLDKIFDSFIQEDGSTSRKYGGTGLGTTISKRLVELMNGSMKVESPNPNNNINNNRGAVFSFQIPFKEPEVAQIGFFKEQIDLGNLTVVILDDNLTNILILSKMLNNWGIRNYSTFNQNEALDLIKKHKPNLFICDFTMPGMNGLEFIARTRSSIEQNDFKVILASSDTINTNQEIARQNNIDVLLYKPIKQSDLYNAIQKALNGGLMRGNETKKVELTKFENAEKFKILLVEDNLINQKVAIKLFQSFGFEIELAENGKIALEYVLEKKYDIIFMDYQMPELNGIEATQAIRKWKIDTPIIALTANAMKGDREKFIESGMNDYLSKPFKRGELLDVLHKYLKEE